MVKHLDMAKDVPEDGSVMQGSSSSIRIYGVSLSNRTKRDIIAKVRLHAEAASRTDHALSRAEEKGVSENEMLDCLRSGEIVDVWLGRERGDRVLLRDGYGVCVCVMIDVPVVVTVYRNSPSDLHRETLRASNYLLFGRVW